MRKSSSLATFVMAAIAAFSLCLWSNAAFAQQKAPGAQAKHQTCIAKARAENPHPADGRARQAAFNRCMGR
jgi:hypothetical protein